jgi:hypothetical protein
MKMQKLDSKQVPQVIALGVLSVGIFGYAVFAFAGSGPKPSPNKSTAKSTSSTSSSASATGTSPAESSVAGTRMALSVAETGGDPAHPAGNPEAAPGINLPGQYNPDPFKATVKPEAPKTVQVTPKPAPAPVKPRPAPQLPDASLRGPATPLTNLIAPPPMPAGPERPEVRVTGTSVTDGMNLAILEIGPEHRVVQVGDVVSKGYRVKKIQLQGVVFAKDKDHFFQGVGAKSDPNKPDNAQDKSSQL